MQKKTEAEQLIPIVEEEYKVFMAIVEKVGKDRRGVPVYRKDQDGAELLFENVKQWLSTDDMGQPVVKERKERVKMIDDDLPRVSAAYRAFLNS